MLATVAILTAIGLTTADAPPKPRRGERREAYWVDAGDKVHRAFACRSLAAYREYWEGIDIGDADVAVDLLRSGRGYQIAVGTPVLVLRAVEIKGDSDDLPAAAEARVLEGERRGERVWIAATELHPPGRRP